MSSEIGVPRLLLPGIGGLVVSVRAIACPFRTSFVSESPLVASVMEADRSAVGLNIF